VQAHLDRIAAVNPKINAIVTLADGALKAAKAAEAAVCWRATKSDRCTVSPSR
jgi:Asp-tRNA(Asn)/Glu-tRNA(Gln) amidotransferase A subunit family amidase